MKFKVFAHPGESQIRLIRKNSMKQRGLTGDAMIQVRVISGY